jgi:hypothetical protein
MDIMENLPALPPPIEYQQDAIQQMGYQEFGLGKSTVYARFYIGAMKDNEASTPDAPVYMEKILCLLQISGEKDNQTVIAVLDGSEKDHRRLYPQAWELFEKNQGKVTVPLQALPQMRPAVIAAFKELGIHNMADVIEKPLPEYLQQYKKWAQYIQSVHDMANGKPKLRIVA